MGKSKLISILLISICLASLIYAVVGRVTSFNSQTNPFNITFSESINQTFSLDIPRYVYMTNVTLRLEGHLEFTTNLSIQNNYTTYNCSTLNITDCPNTVDDDFSTYGRLRGNPFQQGSLWENFTILHNNSVHFYNYKYRFLVCNNVGCSASIELYCLNTSGSYSSLFSYSSSNNAENAIFTRNDTIPSQCLLNNSLFSTRVTLTANSDGLVNSDLWFYEGQILYVNKSYYPSNTTIYIAGDNAWNYSNEFKTIENASLNITKINNILSNNCDEGELIGYNCRINFTFHSDSAGILQVNLTNATYSFGLDNCSNSFSIPSNASAFNFTTRNENTNALVVSNTSFNIQYYPDTPSVYYTYAPTIYNKNNYEFCKYPSWAVFNATMYNTISAVGYENKNFNEYNILLQDTLTAYLLEIGGTTSQITFTIKNTQLANIEGALFQIIRTIDGVPTLVYSQNTDSNGQVVTYLNTEYTYTFNITAEGYPDKTISFQPASTAYTIILTSTATDFFASNYPYQGIRYKIVPPTSMWNVSNAFTNITFYLEGSNFEYWGMNLTSDWDFECIPANCASVSTAVNGGSVTVSIKLNATERFYTSLYFKRSGETITYLNSYANDAVIFRVASRGLIQMFYDIKENTSPLFRTIITAVLEAAFVVVASSIGIVGYPVMAVLVFAIIFLSLPPMPVLGFEGIGFIDPLVGLFMVIIGIGAYLFIEMSGGV